MADAHSMPASVADERGPGIGRGTADWLCLAATPVFAMMAVLSATSGGEPDLLCAAIHGTSPLNGMAVMYALMSVFHLAPWLRLIAARRA